MAPTVESFIKPERRIVAIALSKGVGIGRVVLLAPDKPNHNSQVVNTDAELRRLDTAMSAAIEGLKTRNDDEDIAAIFDVQLAMLQDATLKQQLEQIIAGQKVNAETAIDIAAERFRERQDAAGEERFREKSLDIEDALDRVRQALDDSPSGIETFPPGSVIAARELRPSTVIEIGKSSPAAIITERGGWTSHTSIVARGLKIPMVSGLRNIMAVLTPGDAVIVDGTAGEVILDPTHETAAHYTRRRSASTPPTDSIVSDTLATLDGTQIALRANVDSVAAYNIAKENGARGIGLFRSESLLGRAAKIPSVEAQAKSYRALCLAAGDLGVNVRTFDIGTETSTERNPALGLRSIRLSLTEPDVLRAQISAILTASTSGAINIVLPMISGVAEIRRVKEIIAEEKEQLGAAAGNPRVGAMIEIPSAVMTAREIAEETDFLCLGTNDLVQYMLAVDRDNETVAQWYQTLHPAVLHSIEHVLNAAAETGKRVIVCGEMAGSPFYVPLLLGLGTLELSVNPVSIPAVRALIAGIGLEDCRDLVNSTRGLRTSDEIESLLRHFYSENWQHLFLEEILHHSRP